MIDAATYRKIDILNMDYNIQQENINKIQNLLLRELNNTRFCPPKIIKYVEKCNQYMKISSGPIALHYIYKDILDESFYKILRTLKHCLLIHDDCKLRKNFNIYIAFTPYKRYICKTKPIDSVNINGGFTNTSLNDIFILRKEEYTKVIIHEMLHHSKEIHNDNWPSVYIKELKKEFNISHLTKLVPNEAVVELWATIYYILFLSFEYKIDVKTLLNVELQYSMSQSNKILKKQNTMPWVEYTNSYCYIIFKTILLIAYMKMTLPQNNPEAISKYLITHKGDIIKKNAKYDKTLRMMKLSDL
jgi:hypothetical protein